MAPEQGDEASALILDVRRRALAFRGVERRPRSTYTELRSHLAGVPRDRRDDAWAEASVLLDVAFRRRPDLARRRLRSLLQGHRAAGRDEAFTALWEQVRLVSDPYVLGAHGYSVPLGQRDEGALWRDVSELTKAVAELGHDSCVISGTLLGLIREGGVIDYDDDLDLLVLLTSEDPVSAAREWTGFARRCLAAGILNERFRVDEFIHLKAATRTGVGADLFPCWVSDGRVFAWPHTAGTLPRSALLPWDSRDVADEAVRIPADPEAFLCSNYGADWRTPDPAWQFAWGEARSRFPEFLQALGRGHEPGSDS